MSLSTSGIVPRMYDLADEGIPITLAISLHAPNDAIRKTIMPITSTYPLRQILDAGDAYLIRHTAK